MKKEGGAGGRGDCRPGKNVRKNLVWLSFCSPIRAHSHKSTNFKHLLLVRQVSICVECVVFVTVCAKMLDACKCERKKEIGYESNMGLLKCHMEYTLNFRVISCVRPIQFSFS